MIPRNLCFSDDSLLPCTPCHFRCAARNHEKHIFSFSQPIFTDCSQLFGPVFFPKFEAAGVLVYRGVNKCATNPLPFFVREDKLDQSRTGRSDAYCEIHRLGNLRILREKNHTQQGTPTSSAVLFAGFTVIRPWRTWKTRRTRRTWHSMRPMPITMPPMTIIFRLAIKPTLFITSMYTVGCCAFRIIGSGRWSCTTARRPLRPRASLIAHTLRCPP